MTQRVTIQRHFHTWVIFGVGGAGKSTLAATAPKPVIMDSNQGTLSFADRPGYEHVVSEAVESTTDLDRAFNNCRGTGKKDWRKKYQTIVYDHFDDIQSIVLDELQIRVVERDDRRDLDQIDRKEYGIMGNKLRRYVRAMKRIPMHKILICGEMESNETGQLIPSLIGGMKHQLPYLVDHVAYLRVGKKGVRYLHLQPTDTFYAKTRAWWLTPEQCKIRVPDPAEDPAFLTKLFAQIAAGPKGGTTNGESEET